jgi:PqqD family protein of HPr-rel-A system
MDVGAAEQAAEAKGECVERWSAPGRGQLLFLEDDGGTVVFDRRSGQTHILNETAMQALVLLMDRPLRAVDLSQQMALTLEPGSDAPALVHDILSTFDALGLAEPADL